MNGPGDQLSFNTFIKVNSGWGAQGVAHTAAAPVDDTEEEEFSFSCMTELRLLSSQESLKNHLTDSWSRAVMLIKCS